MPPPLRTAVYVDGLNLYYGALRGSPYKWLDLRRFFSLALGGGHAVIKVKYFTALVRGDQERRERQEIYLSALRAYCPAVEICLGHFLSVDRVGRPIPPVQGRERIRIRTYEEKGSDVNLAVHLLNDAWAGTFDCAVVASNDSDLAEAIKLARTRGGRVGIMPPLLNDARSFAAKLKESADFIRQIRKGALAASQLPDHIPQTAIRRPRLWRGKDLLQ
jgi:uncharacterized LabA/DUF88 family protein